MRRVLVCALTAVLAALPALASLPNGTRAPDINTAATLAGKEFTFSLADALKKGPVVLYFYPAAFTPGCTKEAHLFAEATPQFEALGATVIGVSHDPIEKLDKYSVLESHPEYANRTSYVIAPSGEIIYSYTAMNPDAHVDNTMAAVRKWRDQHSKS